MAHRIFSNLLRISLAAGLLLAACSSGSPWPAAGMAAPGRNTTGAPAPEPVEHTFLRAAPMSAAPTVKAQAPRVVERLPAAVTINAVMPAIAIVFDQPMDPDSLTGAVHIDPPAAHSLRVKANRIDLVLEEPLRPSTSYHITLDATARSARGLPLAEKLAYSFYVEPVLGQVSGPTVKNPELAVSLFFNYSLDPVSLQESVQFTPPLQGHWRWNSIHTIGTFVLDGTYEAATRYVVSFTRGVFDATGQSLAQPHAGSFLTPPAVAASESTDGFMLTFNRPMNHASVEAAFSIEPALPGSLTWADNRLVFRPDAGYLQENTAYDVTLSAKALTSLGGRLLTEDFHYSYWSGDLPDVVTFGYGPNLQAVDSAGRRAVQFSVYAADLTAVDLTLYRLTLDQFLAAYKSYQDDTVSGHKPPVFAGRTPAYTWTSSVSASPDYSGRGINETLIPAEVTPDLYLMTISHGHVNDWLFIVLSSRTLLVKQAGSQVMSWLTDTNGGPAGAVPVTIYSGDGRPIALGQTGPDGVFQMDLPPQSAKPDLVVAGDDTDRTVAGLSYSWQVGTSRRYWDAPSPVLRKTAAYIYTDRPIYRPGQTVYYKAIVRQDSDAALEVLPQGSPITVRIRDSRRNLVDTRELSTNQFGTINSSFDLAPGAMLGSYLVEVDVNGETHSQTFKVEDYRKPDFEVKVTMDAAGYVAGARARVVVEARYLYGEPVAGAKVSLVKYMQPRHYCWEVCNSDPDWVQLDASDAAGTTDAQGRFTLAVDAGSRYAGDMLFDRYLDWWSNLRYGVAGLEVTVDDGSHQTVSSLVTYKVYEAADLLRLDTHGYLQAPDKPFDITLSAQTVTGQPESGRSYDLHVERWRPESDVFEPAQPAVRLTTGSDGLAAARLSFTDTGYYRLSLNSFDAFHNKIELERWFYVFSGVDSWTGAASGLKITVDRDTYAVGDSAQILIETPVSGPALLTYERGAARRQEVVSLTAPLTRLSVPISPADVPNVYLTVNQWLPQDTTLKPLQHSDWEVSLSRSDSRLGVSSVELRVPAANKHLTVTLTPDKATYTPGENAMFKVRVTDYKGDPVSGEVSLALVDDAIFLMSQDPAGSIFDAFYFERPNLVSTYDSMAPTRYLPCECGGGGGGGGPLGSLGPRTSFPDTAIWAPALQTDWNGEASLSLRMPDTLTRWRLTARATTADTQVGEATATVTTFRPIVVRPLLPRTLTEGDRFSLAAMVYNYSASLQTLTVTLDPGDRIATGDPLSQRVSLAAGRQAVVSWSGVATQAGPDVITISAVEADAASGDAVSLPLAVQPLAVPQATAEVGAFSGGYSTSLSLPAGASDQSSFHVRLSRSVAGSLLDGLDYLTGFPYGCVEQTMSKALPNAVVGRAFKQLGIGSPLLQADLTPKIDASLQRLYGYQHDDGGWGWWYDDSSDDYETAWVIFGLSMTAGAGHPVDQSVIKRGADWLTDDLPHMDTRTRAFALYSLALAGYGSQDATLDLVHRSDSLDPFSLAALALALNSLGAHSEANTVLDLLEKSAVTADSQVYWIASADDGSYHAKTMASTTRSTAMALSAFAAVRPDSHLEAGIVRYLMNHRQLSGWGTTNETSFTIMALTDYVLARQTSPALTGYRIELNGQAVASGSLDRTQPEVDVTLPLNSLHTGSNPLRLVQTGTGELYFVVSSRVIVSQPELPAAGQVSVTRTYFAGESNDPVHGPVDAGQLIRVHLAVDMPDDGYYILLEDKLPGGFEALNESLNTTSHEGRPASPDTYWPEEVSSWKTFGYNNKEIYGDRVSFFITQMSKGRSEFDYYVRAVQPGIFTALPAELTAMYDVTVWGRSASSHIQIVSK